MSIDDDEISVIIGEHKEVVARISDKESLGEESLSEQISPDEQAEESEQAPDQQD